MMGPLNVGVLGAGVVGLTTALELQKEFRDARLTVIADKFNQDTTSDGAAGIFEPGPHFRGPTFEITKGWIRDSYEYYHNLMPENCGIQAISGYSLSNRSQESVMNPLMDGIVPVFRVARKDELSSFSESWKYGSYSETLLIECRYYLPWALSKFEKAGGKIVNGRLSSFSEVTGQFDVVLNCTGLGSGQLCNDTRMIPLRGQILKVSAPWLEHFYYDDRDTYIIPASGGIATLGGTRNYGSWNLEPSKHDTASIQERAAKILPRMGSAPILRTWVGLRPYRDVVRVEPDFISGVKVVHNYGHGGYGVTSAPGTAMNAVRLVRQVLATRNKL